MATSSSPVVVAVGPTVGRAQVAQLALADCNLDGVVTLDGRLCTLTTAGAVFVPILRGTHKIQFAPALPINFVTTFSSTTAGVVGPRYPPPESTAPSEMGSAGCRRGLASTSQRCRCRCEIPRRICRRSSVLPDSTQRPYRDPEPLCLPWAEVLSCYRPKLCLMRSHAMLMRCMVSTSPPRSGWARWAASR